MATLFLERASASRIHHIYSVKGIPHDENKRDPCSAAYQADLTKLCRIDKPTLLAYFREVPEVGDSKEFTVPDPPEPDKPAPFEISVRGIREPSIKAQRTGTDDPLDALRQVFATEYMQSEPVLSWSGIDRLACLDIDYHRFPMEERPDNVWFANRVAGLQPAPPLWHVSHGKGAKLYYSARDGFKAYQLAAAGGVAWLQMDPRATVEIKHDSRHPRYARREDGRIGGDIRELEPTVNLDALRLWFGRQSDPEATEIYLAEKGWAVGERLAHDHCPIAPGIVSHGEPVYVGDAGVHCKTCEAAGRAIGGKPGFVSYTRLAGGVPSPLYDLARHLVHWHHAKYVLAHELKLPESFLRLAYDAALAVFHGPADPRIEQVFRASDIVRMESRWVCTSDNTTYGKDILPILKTLPATWIPGPKRSHKENVLNHFQQTQTLEEWGYRPLQPVKGCVVYGHHLTYTNPRKIPFVVPANYVKDSPQFAARYLSEAERLPIDDAWEVYERQFPRVNREYLMLLICAKGCAEGAIAMPPVIFTDGPSGSAKTGTIHLAASTCGDDVGEVVYNTDTDRFRQGIMAACTAGGFVACNEIIKDAMRARIPLQSALEPILNLTPDSFSHVLYLGSAKLGQLPALILTDINCPQEVRQNAQLARRLVHVRLRERLEWEKTLARGVGEIRRFRVASAENAKAADSLVSYVIDRFFCGAPRPFADIAEELGFPLLEKSEDFDDPVADYQEFYRLVCAAPALNPNSREGKRWNGRGWKVIKRGDQGDLAEAWRLLCDGDGPRWGSSARLTEQDWGRILGVERGSVKFRPHHHGEFVAVRYWIGDSKCPTAVNEEIKGV